MSREQIREFIEAADALRVNWLNDGYEIREPNATYFRNAKRRYDEAREAIAKSDSF